jgi:EAL domain-containing protein (putative c-di-GMP-specific phosphodiesterase class I)
VERGQLMLYYQPQATVDAEIFGFKALFGWRHPTRGIIPFLLRKKAG